jgi:hypothetical protein
VERADRPVARVERVTGEGGAIATRADGGERDLVPGAQLFSYDDVTTRDSAVVEVRVFHNKTRVLLSRAAKRKLVDTRAWLTDADDKKAAKLVFIDRENKDETPSTGTAVQGADTPGAPDPGGPPPPEPVTDEPAAEEEHSHGAGKPIEDATN